MGVSKNGRYMEIPPNVLKFHRKNIGKMMINHHMMEMDDGGSEWKFIQLC